MKGRRAYSKIFDLSDRTHIRFDSLRRIKLAEYGQQREAEVRLTLDFAILQYSCLQGSATAHTLEQVATEQGQLKE